MTSVTSAAASNAKFTFVLELRGDRLQMRAPANKPGEMGVRAVLDGDWSFQMIR